VHPRSVLRQLEKVFVMAGLVPGMTNQRYALNVPGSGCDQWQISSRGGMTGDIFMQSVRPDSSDPIPLRRSPPGMGTIMIRFVGLLVLAVVVLALVWSR
jgi:hypothetical protein